MNLVKKKKAEKSWYFSSLIQWYEKKYNQKCFHFASNLAEIGN